MNSFDEDRRLEIYMELKRLDFSLIGILSKISGILADNRIGIFAVSTYNTDYILVKEENYERAMSVLADSGYTVV